jgi:hypothetical protein
MLTSSGGADYVYLTTHALDCRTIAAPVLAKHKVADCRCGACPTVASADVVDTAGQVTTESECQR